MSGEELDVLLKLAEESQRTSNSTRELKEKISNLKSAEG